MIITMGDWSNVLGIALVGSSYNPLLILSPVDIILSGRLLYSLPLIVYAIVYSIICQVTALSFFNSFSIVYSVLYFLPPIVCL